MPPVKGFSKQDSTLVCNAGKPDLSSSLTEVTTLVRDREQMTYFFLQLAGSHPLRPGGS